jgi:hypothetical protein
MKAIIMDNILSRRWIFIMLLVLLPVSVWAGHEHPEKWYQRRWCVENRGELEVVLPDGTRCDCLTATNAVEFDFGAKWAEAIGTGLVLFDSDRETGGSRVDSRKTDGSEVLDSDKHDYSSF